MFAAKNKNAFDLLKIIFCLFVAAGCKPKRQTDATIPNIQSIGVLRHEKSSDKYFIVQNWTYSSECSVYEDNGKFIFRFPGEFCLFSSHKYFVTYNEGELVFYDPKMNILWKHKIEIHHDIDLSDQRKEVATIYRKTKRINNVNRVDDVVVVYNFKGEPVFEWKVTEHAQELEKIYNKKLSYEFDEVNNVTYLAKLNSIQIIPPNILEKQNSAFAAGNILINDRLNSSFLILDRNGTIVWSKVLADSGYRSGHSPKLNSEGNILFFKNHVPWPLEAHELKELQKKKVIRKVKNGKLIFTKDYCTGDETEIFYSKLIEFNPLTQKVIWEYIPQNKLTFCSSYYGYSQLLDTGNVLVSHISNGGSAFEVNRRGEIVWEWINPLKDEKGRAKRIYKVLKIDKDKIDPFLK